jgi:RNA polymerase sigma-70 factor (ECF subfamily)
MKNEEEFIALVETNNRVIYKVCSLYISPVAPMEDLYQEVVANLWRGYAKFRGESTLSTWIYRIALNTCVSYMRKQNRASRQIEVAEMFPIPLEIESGDGDRVEVLYRLIATLGDVDKAVILLWLEEKSYVEIAEIIGLTVANVGVRLNRIKNRLKTNELWNSTK